MAVDQIRQLYESMPGKLDRARRCFGHAFTLAEKILVTNADDFDTEDWATRSSGCAFSATTP